MPLDGDMAESILPAKNYDKIFADPFGISVITKHSVYPNPNRFFAQWAYMKYFRTIPFVLQNFTNPINSVYLAAAISKTIIYVGILILSGFYITGSRTLFKKEFLFAIALIIPLFQINGYCSYMGIIDPSITYTFSYALPCALLLLFYLPFFNTYFYQRTFVTNKILLFLLAALTIIITFNGPLIPGAVLVIALLYFFHQFMLNNTENKGSPFSQKAFSFFKNIPKAYFFFFGFLSILSLYSLYIGRNNSQFILEQISVSERYSRLPQGFYFLLTRKIGYPLLLIMIGANAYFINKNYKTADGKKILSLLKWIGIFSILYIVLLPLGGYRSYRPNIIRYDSIMPITIALIIFYGLSTYFLITHFKNNSRMIYIVTIIGFSFVYTLADEPEWGKNKCEINALEKLAASREKIVLLENDCSVLAWEKIKDPRSSELNARLLQFWGITNEEKLYYQK
ncbi:MAG: hypothetical protein ACXVPU_08850 [Bacteroidia bacterium]